MVTFLTVFGVTALQVQKFNIAWKSTLNKIAPSVNTDMPTSKLFDEKNVKNSFSDKQPYEFADTKMQLVTHQSVIDL
jgi:hypothetical protein